MKQLSDLAIDPEQGNEEAETFFNEAYDGVEADALIVLSQLDPLEIVGLNVGTDAALTVNKTPRWTEAQQKLILDAQSWVAEREA